MKHECTKEECGWSCHYEDGEPVRSIHISFDDSSGIDADDQPCPCEEHTEDNE